jgi:hypothetical protein
VITKRNRGKGEEAELMRIAIEVAKAGDVAMLKFFLGRILPKERCVRVDFPELDGASDAVDALKAIIDAVRNGQISPSEAEALTNVVAAYARTIDVAEFEERLEKLERDVVALK